MKILRRVHIERSKWKRRERRGEREEDEVEEGLFNAETSVDVKLIMVEI